MRRSARHVSLIAVAGPLLLATVACVGAVRADAPPQPEIAPVVVDGDHIAGPTTLPAGSALQIEFTATFGSGRSWVLEPLAPGGPLIFAGTHDEHRNSGGAGMDYQVFSFRAQAPGTATLVFDYRRPWMKNEPPRETRRIVINLKS